jgi:aminoglycoside phosphotransferase (APT) family kinase protein
MERLEGSTLQDEWPRLTAAENIDVASKLGNCIEEIRKLPSPTGGYCGLGSSPVPDSFFWKDSDEEQINGPFVTEEEFNRGLTDVISSGSLTKPFRHVFFRRGVGTILKDHPPVFTHGDLQRKNIVIRRTTGPNDGECTEFQVSLVDWENAGWYPTYWEYFKSMFACRWDDDWSEHLDTIILDPYYVEWSFCNTLFLEAFY